MKKFLSLVLALVMTMSLVTISAGAKDFTDNSKIAYKEAVDVVSTIGIVDGYEDGAFNPTNELTRGAAAKIICNLILGPTTASALSADTAPFKDVPTTNTFAGYIAYCAQQGIISGYADGTFRPAAPLTGYAFMKMLLGALGYDATIEGFVGANWSVQVGKQALGIGLDDGNDDFVGTKAVTREEACLYVFNTLQATMVQYDSKITANVNGAEVTIGNSKATPVEWATGKKNDGNIDTVKGGDGFVQFAEQYFDKLVLKSGTDDFARPANIWEYKSNEIGTYAKTADASYTKKVEVGDIYKDLGLTKTVVKADVEVYVDGVENATQSPVAIKKGDDDNKYGANGVLTEVFFDEDNGTVTITEVNTYVAEVTKNVAATSKKDAYVQIATLDAAPSKTGNLEYETEETFEEDSYVQYTFSESAKAVKSVMETESVSGTATKVINKVTDADANNGMTIADTEYKVAKMVSGETLGSVSVKNDYTIYLDQYGYILYIEEEELAAQDYALVLQTANRGSFVGKKAELVFADGTTGVVTTDKNYASGDDAIANYTIVSFKEDNGVYTLKPVSTKQAGGGYNQTVRFGTLTLTGGDFVVNAGSNDNFALTNDKASVVVGKSGGSPVSVTANSKTVFVVRDTNDHDDYTSYTGIKNAPSVKAEDVDGNSTIDADEKVTVFYYCKNNSMTTVMFVFPGDGLTIEDNSNKMLYLAVESVSDLQHDANSDYFEYNAVINGEITTVKVDDGVTVGSMAANELSGLFKTYSVDKYGVITKLTSYPAYSGSDASSSVIGTGVDKRSADYTVTLDTAGTPVTITVDDNATFFTVDKKGNISNGTYRSVVKDSNDHVFAMVKDYLVQTLIVETVEDGTGYSGNLSVTLDEATNTATVEKYTKDTNSYTITDKLTAIEEQLGREGYTLEKTSRSGATYKFETTDRNGVAIDFNYNPSINDVITVKITVDNDVKYVSNAFNINDITAATTVYVTDKDGNVTTVTGGALATTAVKDGYTYNTTAAAYKTITVKTDAADAGTAKTVAPTTKVSDLGLTGHVWNSTDSAVALGTDTVVDGKTYVGDYIKVVVDTADKYVANGTKVSGLSLSGVVKVNDTVPAAGTDELAEGDVVVSGLLKVEFAAVDLSAFDNTTAVWTIPGVATPVAGTSYYVESGDKVVCTISTSNGGFTADVVCTLTGSDEAEAKVETQYYLVADPAVASEEVTYTNTEQYAGGAVSFTWTITTDNTSIAVTAKNAAS